jgi:PAS domain S-box-containing protein
MDCVLVRHNGNEQLLPIKRRRIAPRAPVCLALCLALIALTGNVLAMARESASIGASIPGGSLGPWMDFLIDPDGSLDLATVRQLPDFDDTPAARAGAKASPVWRHVKGDNIIGGYTDEVYWVRFSVHNATDIDTPWILEVNYALLDHIDLYIPDAANQYVKIESGDRVPFRQRPLDYRHFAAPLLTAAQTEQTYYLRIQTESSMYIDLRMWPVATFAEAMDGQLLLFGLLYGVVFLAGVYCLINGIFMRERMYSFIAIAIFCAAGYSLSLNGFGFQYVWPEHTWLQSISVPFFVNVSYGFSLLYSREFLDMKRCSRFTDKMLFGWGLACLAVAVASLFASYKSVIRISALFAIIVSLSAVWAGTISLYSGNRSARYFVVGWLAMSMGAGTFALKSMGLVPSNLFTVWMQEFGFAGVALFLTLAQSDRFFQTQRKHVTEQSALMKAIRSAEKKYRSLFENAIEGIFQMSLEGQLVNANAAFARILGCDNVATLLAQPHPAWSLQCLPEGERDRFKSLLDKEQAVKSFETGFTLPSGETRWIAVSAQLVRGKLDDASHYEGAMADITETRKRQQAEKQQRMAEASTEAKSLFLANMSHEIRTPMNAIIGFTDLALQHNQEPRLTDYLRKTRVASSNLLGIINDILDFSKIEAGKLEIEHIPFSLQDVLNNLSNLVSVSVAARQLALKISVDADIPDALVGDPLRIGQVLLNLTNNAIKFTPQGQVTVTLELVSLHKREMSIVLRGSVRDTGIGIPAEKLAGLFSSFTQVDESTTRRFGGTGLGLSISKQLIGMMGGELSVESDIGKGSTFSFTLACQLQDRRQRQNPHFNSGQLPLNILVIDDQQEARELLEKALISLAHNVTCVGSSAAALHELRKQQQAGTPYDVLLTDWLMPDTDGISCCQQVRDDPTLTTPRMVVVTGYDLDEVKKNAQGIGIDAFIAKPVRVQELSKVLQAVFQDRRTDQAQAGGAPGEHYFTGLRVLVVEDVAMNQELAREILGSKGIVVSLANNGEEGVAAVAQGDFDLVLMDMQMPVLDGCQASEKIRQFNRKLPIIAMTANAMATDRNKCLAAGMNDYVTKPINTDELFAVMARWVKAQRPPASPPSAPQLAPPGPVAPEPAAPEPAALQPAQAPTPIATPAAAALVAQPVAHTPAPQAAEQVPLPASLPGVAIGEGLKRCMGNTGLYLRFLSDFRRDQASSGMRFRAFIDAGDMASVMAQGHKLKGLAGNLAARGVADAAAALEKASSPTDVAQALTAFEAELQIFIASIDQLLAPQPQCAPQSALPPSASSKPATLHFTPDELAARLDALLPLIRARKISAFDLAQDYLARWPLAHQTALLGELSTTLDAFDFAQAEQLLEALRQGLDSSASRT